MLGIWWCKYGGVQRPNSFSTERLQALKDLVSLGVQPELGPTSILVSSQGAGVCFLLAIPSVQMELEPESG